MIGRNYELPTDDMVEKYSAHLFTPAKEYLKKLSAQERARITFSISLLQQGDNDSVYTKQLDGPIRELVIGYHRVTYFVLSQTVYAVNGFRKKSAKTPKQHIDFARKMYKYIKTNF
ncbi:MAG: hypothetical protein A2762_00030 [Candidatus Lloydbacteria bacterium RIFCSPHIGHO2_01_FULL_54_11]|nr:MAG: hypothetical protein A2762_00030 [Candidatus Lloydbacteria bacterium RIFCSPHIGHO2_01_FULL_54_11]OGZ13197.1 MAG: hypothetical protein A2948_05985 [Candidatus Lloydbacteria bacterium RIFCSPLOWO2_01_FULL_54_18]